MSGENVYIAKTASFLPNQPVGNDEMERIIGQIGPRPSRVRKTILRSNKITQRYYAIDPVTLEQNYTNATMTAEAVRLLSGDDFHLRDLQCLCCGTTIPDQLMPNHALMVQGELGAPPCEAVATAGICLSGITAMKYAYLSVLAGDYMRAVCTGSDLASAFIHARHYSAETDASPEDLERAPELAFDKDFLRWMLSDGAGAFLLQPTPPPGRRALRIDWIDLFSYAGEMPPCMYAGAEKSGEQGLTGWTALSQQEVLARSVMSVKQDVHLLNEHVVPYTVTRPLQVLQERRALKAADVDYFLPHYSSGYFRDKVHACMCDAGFDVPQEKWFTNLERKGNTGAAAFYIILDELFQSGRLNPGERLLCYVPESGRFSTAFIHLTVV